MLEERVEEMVNHPVSAPAWRAVREPPMRKIALMLGFSALLHVLLTPLAGLLGVFAWLLTPPPPVDLTEAEQLRSIPISVIAEDALAPTPAPEEVSPPAAPELAEPPPPKVEAPREAAPVKAPPPPRAPAERPLSALPSEPPAQRKQIEHPVAAAGVATEIVDSNANVNLLLLTERVRQHPLGERIGKLIVNFPQWSSFFASGEIDPVRDLNRILVVGPQFRRSADVVAILHHGMPPAVVKEAVDRLVQRPPRGRWLDGKIPAARAHADRAERLFALSAPNILVVAPPHLEKQILAAPPTQFPTPDGEVALVLHVKTPWRALMGLPFTLPESLAWLRLDVLPLADGGAQLRLTAEDVDASTASNHAQSLTLALNAITNPDLGPLGALVGLRSIALLDKIYFQANGQRISGQVRVTPRQLDRLLSYTEELVAQWTGRRARGGASVALPARPPQPPPNRPAAAKAPGSVQP